MASLDYAPVPICASLMPLQSGDSRVSRGDEELSPGAPPLLPAVGEEASTRLASPRSFNLTNLLISSAINIPSTSSSPRGAQNFLLSAKEPLAIPLMTYNSRRFMSRVGFVFWTTDRIEEIVMWRKGWTHTLPWVIVYVLICYQPKLLLFVPNVVILCIMLITYQPSQNIPRSNGTRTTITDPSRSIRSHPPLPVPASEGSAAWLANVQGVQNLMGLVADAYDAAAPMVPYLTWRSRSSSILFLFALFLTISLWFIPLRLAFLSIGLFLFTATHPLVREALISPHAQLYFRQHGPFLWDRVRQFMNDAHLPERIIPHLNELRSVEVFQNERWAWPSSSAVSAAHGETLPAGWKNGAANLKPTERLPWTRGKDGSGGVGSASGVLNFSLEPHWAYVESEDWEPDFYGWWTAKDSVSRTDSDGWLYTNDAWLDPHRSPPAEWQKAGLMTRRRRWTRRIYYIGP